MISKRGWGQKFLFRGKTLPAEGREVGADDAGAEASEIEGERNTAVAQPANRRSSRPEDRQGSEQRPGEPVDGDGIRIPVSVFDVDGEQEGAEGEEAASDQGKGKGPGLRLSHKGSMDEKQPQANRLHYFVPAQTGAADK